MCYFYVTAKMTVIQQTQKIIVAALSLFYYCETSGTVNCESEKQGNLF